MPVTWRQTCGQMERKSALVAANIESAALPGCTRDGAPSRLRGSVVGALVEKRAGFLAGVGVVMKDESVEMKLRAGRPGERVRQATSGSALGAGRPSKLADARIGPLENRRRREFFAKHAHAGFACASRKQTFGEELQNDQVAVFVGDDAGQFVGLAEAKTAGVVGGVEQRFAPRDGRAQPCLEQFEPCGLIDGLARDEAQRDLRRGTVESRAEEEAAVVGDRQQKPGRLLWILAGAKRLNVRSVDPQMAGAQTIGGAARDDGSRKSDRLPLRRVSSRLGAPPEVRDWSDTA